MTRKPRRLRGTGDGGITTTTLVLVLPALLVTVLVVIQFALAYHARHVLTAAAQDAAFAATARSAPADAARRTAERVVGDGGRGLVRDVAISVDDTATAVRVEVRAAVASVVGGLRLHVSGVAESPRERFVAQRAP